MRPCTLLFYLALPFLVARPGLATELWIEPLHFQVQSGAVLEANIRVGTAFAGQPVGFSAEQSVRFDLILHGQTTTVNSAQGDVPALYTTAPENGLLVIVHKTAPEPHVYQDWDSFQSFAKHKHFPAIHARHLARNLPETGFTESDTHHVKALVGVGSSEGMDERTGMETEFVALSNPYTDDPSGGFVVTLYYQDTLRTNAQIKVFDRDSDGKVTVSMEQTDGSGQAIIPIQSGHTYLLDAVVLRASKGDDDVAWETLWAGLTFSVP